jgi:hypothetical protein
VEPQEDEFVDQAPDSLTMYGDTDSESVQSGHMQQIIDSGDDASFNDSSKPDDDSVSDEGPGPPAPGPAPIVVVPPGPAPIVAPIVVVGPAQQAMNAWINGLGAADRQWALNPANRIALRRYALYNPITNAIEVSQRMNRQFLRRRAPRNHRASYEFVDVHQPFMRRDKKIHRVSRYIDPLHHAQGEHDRIGSFIEIKALPSVWNICIKLGVQIRALHMLVQRIVDHGAENKLNVIQKRKKDGKYSYHHLFDTKEIEKLGNEVFVEKLVKLLQKRKYIHLIVKPVKSI